MLNLKNDEMRGGTRLIPEMNKRAMEQNIIILQNELGKFLLDLYRKEKWLAIKLLLLFNAQSRWLELNLIFGLADMNRWDEISRFYELLKQDRWDEVTARLAEMTTPPESRNFFNESMLTDELKDMYQYYQFLIKNNQVDEANKLYNEIVNISESRVKKLDAARIDVLKANALHTLNSTNALSQTSAQNVESTSNEKLAKFFYEECEKRFIEEYHLLNSETPGDDGKYPIYIWEKNLCHYRRIENLTELYSRLKKLSRTVSSEMGYDRPTLLTEQKTREIVDNLTYSPELTVEARGINRPEEEQVFFRNGYYDLSEGKFYQTSTTGYFHLFCLPYDYSDYIQRRFAWRQINTR